MAYALIGALPSLSFSQSSLIASSVCLSAYSGLRSQLCASSFFPSSMTVVSSNHLNTITLWSDVVASDLSISYLISALTLQVLKVKSITNWQFFLHLVGWWLLLLMMSLCLSISRSTVLACCLPNAYRSYVGLQASKSPVRMVLLLISLDMSIWSSVYLPLWTLTLL